MKCFLLLLLLFTTSYARAEYTVTYGLEMEFSSKTFANFIHYFDMDDLQKKAEGKIKIPDSLYDDYLLNPKAFEALPLDLKLKLGGGLPPPKIEFEKPELEKPEGKVVLGPDGRASRSNGAKILGIDGEPFSTVVQFSSPEIEVPKNAEATAFAAQVHKAWRALPLEEKRRLVEFKYLPRLEQARIAILMEKGSLDSGSHVVRLRSVVPPEIESLFGKMRWHRDGDGMEFKYAFPTTKQDEYLSDVRQMARLAGVESYLDRPLEKPNGLFTYHNNIGRKEEARVGHLANALNLRSELNFIAKGKMSAETRPAELMYTLVRDRNQYVEVREHFQPFEEETKGTAEFLRQENEAAIASVGAEIGKLLKDQPVFDFLSQHRPNALAAAAVFAGDSFKDPRVAESLLRHADALLAGNVTDPYPLQVTLQNTYINASEGGRALRRELANYFQSALDPTTLRKLESTLGEMSTMSLLKETFKHADREHQRMSPYDEAYFDQVLDQVSSDPEFVKDKVQRHGQQYFMTRSFARKLRYIPREDAVKLAEFFLVDDLRDPEILEALAKRLTSKTEPVLEKMVREWYVHRNAEFQAKHASLGKALESLAARPPCDLLKEVDP